jgi:signal transduction histidine kinase
MSREITPAQAVASAAFSEPFVRTVLEASGTAMLIVDGDRRVIGANALAVKATRARDEIELFGRFMGDVLGCTHTEDVASSCGDGPSCHACGGLKALRESLSTGERAEEECLVTRSRGGIADAAELHVIATPIDIGGRRCALLSLRDISDEKRRRTLERIFVHDLNNIVASLAAWVDLLDDPDAGIRGDAIERVRRLTAKIVDEIRSHSLVALVESEEFSPTWRGWTPSEVMEQVAAAIGPVEGGGTLVEISGPAPAEAFETDVALLGRVLVNMVRNAIEAAPQGPIRLGCRRVGEGYRFSVNNPGVIGDDVAARIFRRSFSTKAPHGRGLGTYSMKLFGERVLGGIVGFTSDAARGTTFFIDHPLARRTG